MGNAIYAEEESAAEKNSTAMLIYSVTKTSEDVYKLSTSLGSFFLRAFYLADQTEDEELPHTATRLIKASELNTARANSADDADDATDADCRAADNADTEDHASKKSGAGASCCTAQSLAIDFDSITPDTQLSSEASERIIEAALAYSAEHAAVSYLERAEHSAELLRRKLKQKGHSDSAIQKALSYAQKRNWLSDERYAGAFLRNRSIRKAEGKTRLLAELAARGISKEIAAKAVEEFFAQKSEASLLQRAAEKLKRQGKTKEQAQQSLIRLGFPWGSIKSYIKDNW